MQSNRSGRRPAGFDFHGFGQRAQRPRFVSSNFRVRQRPRRTLRTEPREIAAQALHEGRVVAFCKKLQNVAPALSNPTREDILKLLARIAYADMRSVFRFGRVAPRLRVLQCYGSYKLKLEFVNGIELNDSAEFDAGVLARIRSIKISNNSISLKFVSPLRALDLLGEHLGLFGSSSRPPSALRPASNRPLV